MKERQDQFRRKPSKQSGPRINEQIRLQECRLVADGGEQFGVVSMDEARRISEERGIDLIEIAPTAKPPVVKLIDYGKYKYELQKKEAEARKKQVVISLKEIQFKPNIEMHDLQTKLKNANRFINQGDKIKLVMQFRGREMAYKDVSLEKFKGIIQQIVDMGATVESEPKMMGNRIIAIVAALGKSQKKAPKKAEKAEAPKADA